MKYQKIIKIGDHCIGLDYPTYFVADISANHDGDIEKAKDLIFMCAEGGANAAKFQHFHADTIVSDYGFKSLGNQKSHQSGWKKSVYETYKDASLNFEWTPVLQETCQKAGIDFFTSPYSFELVDKVNPFVAAFKIGSGDITWLEIIEYMAKKGKPMILACGASTLDEVVFAVEKAGQETGEVALMQCNTNYTNNLENFRHINLNVLKTFSVMFPDIVLGLSDHTPGHSTVLGAITLGARIIEKHYTEDNKKQGPDHMFSMNPDSWKEMVICSRELESALGKSVKRVEENEKETVILQRRAIRVNKDIKPGDIISKNILDFLRPCPQDALPPYEVEKIVGKTIRRNLKKGSHIKWTDIK